MAVIPLLRKIVHPLVSYIDGVYGAVLQSASDLRIRTIIDEIVGLLLTAPRLTKVLDLPMIQIQFMEVSSSFASITAERGPYLVDANRSHEYLPPIELDNVLVCCIL